MLAWGCWCGCGGAAPGWEMWCLCCGLAVLTVLKLYLHWFQSKCSFVCVCCQHTSGFNYKRNRCWLSLSVLIGKQAYRFSLNESMTWLVALGHQSTYFTQICSSYTVELLFLQLVCVLHMGISVFYTNGSFRDIT